METETERWVIVWRPAYEDTDVYVIPENRYHEILQCQDADLVYKILCEFPTYRNWGEWPKPLTIVGKFILH